MEFKKQNRGPQGKGGKNKMKPEREANHKTLLIIGNRLRVAGGERGWGEGVWRG